MFQLSRAESRRGVTLLAATAVLVTPCVTLAQDSLGLEEVIVTAQKRAEPLQDVPISVTVLTGEQIREMKLNSGTDVARAFATPRARPGLVRAGRDTGGLGILNAPNAYPPLARRR